MAPGVGPLVGGSGPDSHLDERLGQPVLHDPRKRAGVRKTVAVEVFIEVGMGVEVEDIERPVGLGHGPQDGIADGMVPAQDDRHGPFFEDRGHGGLNPVEGPVHISGCIDIAEVDHDRVVLEVDTQLGLRIPGPAGRGRPDGGGTSGRSSQVAGLLVERDSDNRQLVARAPLDGASKIRHR